MPILQYKADRYAFSKIDHMSISLLFLATIVAFWLSAVAGGGASLVLIPILNLMLPPTMVPVSLTIGTFTSNASRIAVFWKNINWKIFAWFVPFSVPAVFCGARIIKFANPSYLEFLVSLFLLANLTQLFKKKNNGTERTVKSRHLHAKLAAIGFSAGLISGLTGAVGLLFNRFYLKFGLKKEEIIATRAANEIFLHLVKLATYFSLGLFSSSAINLGIAIAVASLLSSVTIKFILPHISEHVFRNMAYVAMVVSGSVLLYGSVQSIAKQQKLSFGTEMVDAKPVKTINWTESGFSIEFNRKNGVCIEMPIHASELPIHLQAKFKEYSQQFDKIYLEKVLLLGKKNVYEFSCYVGNKLSKVEESQ